MKSKQVLRALIVTALLALVCVSAAGATPAGTPPQSVTSYGYTYYTVKPGDNLYRISLRFGVPMYTLMQANGIWNPNYIYAGQVLRVPAACSPPCLLPVHPTPIPAGTWRGEYFDNEGLAGAPSVVRYDSAVNFDWGLGRPHPKIATTNFSVRWTRTMWLRAGTWRFTTTTQDGVRLYVDNVLKIDQWQQQNVTSYTADVSLGAGYHYIRMEYFHLADAAVAKLRWEWICENCEPSSCDNCASGGIWVGEYFDNMFLGGGPEFTRFEPAINFDWGFDSPGTNVSKDLWSARWTQTAYFTAGTYRFHALVDDGVRVYVDGRVVIDEWEDNFGVQFIADVTLSQGKHTLKVEYYDRGYGAQCSFWWDKLP